MAEWGRIDALFVNAGGPPAGYFKELSDSQWQAAFELTLLSSIRLIRAVLPHMTEGGAIVASTSSSVREPIERLGLSNVMRAGVAGLVKTLADELAADGIRVNTLMPGRIDTARIAQLDQAAANKRGNQLSRRCARKASLRIPMGRLGTIDEYGTAAAFLLSPAASLHHRGARCASTAARCGRFRGEIMRITNMNWMQVEAYLQQDDRCVLPLGSTEQHAYLSLSVDSILAERVALDAAEPLGIPVFPVLHYGLTPYFRAYPGSITLRQETYVRVVARDPRRPGGAGLQAHPDRERARRQQSGAGVTRRVDGRSTPERWLSSATGGTRRALGPRRWSSIRQASHASWSENFPWTRLAGVAMPAEQKPMIDFALMRILPPDELRAYLGDGNFGGFYQRPDDEMLAIWQVAVEETRELLTGAWGRA